MKSIYSATQDELLEQTLSLGEKKFRLTQLNEWLFKRFAYSWEDMNNIPAAYRAALAERYYSLKETLEIIEVAKDPATKTKKLLSRLHDGELIETVIIPSKTRNTICISSQAGCACGCVFCASGMNGWTRNLELGEIFGQVILAARELGEKPDNIVFMGVGEPFNNYDNAIGAAKLLNSGPPVGLGIGARKITISTCGIVPGIKRFAEEGFQFELSVSLHAPNNMLRDQIMPINKRWKIDELMATCREYEEKTNRIITFEYTLVDGVNNTRKHADELIARLRGLKCKVNLIPLSPVPEYPGKTPSEQNCEQFGAYLLSHGINTTLRRSKGKNVNGACGQLRRQAAPKK